MRLMIEDDDYNNHEVIWDIEKYNMDKPYPRAVVTESIKKTVKEVRKREKRNHPVKLKRGK